MLRHDNQPVFKIRLIISKLSGLFPLFALLLSGEKVTYVSLAPSHSIMSVNVECPTDISITFTKLTIVDSR